MAFLFLVAVAVAVVVNPTMPWCNVSMGATAFSLSMSSSNPTRAKTNRNNKNKKKRKKKNGRGEDPSLVRAARAKFDAWKTSSGSDAGTVREFVVREEDLRDSADRNGGPRGRRIGHFAPWVFAGGLPSKNAADTACSDGSLTVNATKVSGARILQPGDVLALRAENTDRRTNVPSDPHRADRFCASRLRLVKTLQDESVTHSPLRVLYEDRCMAIVCKPAGIHTMSWTGSFGKSLCLDEILPLVLEPPEAGHDDGDEGLPAPLPRHRLDRRVAGPVVVAKTRRALVELGRSFEERTVTKEYRAVVVGTIDATALSGLDGVSNVTTTTTRNSTLSFTISSEVDDKPSETGVEVLGTTPCNVHGVLTDLKLFPKTGRKHQLRIHCARVLGTPILGDDLYWDETGLSEKGVTVRKGQGLYLYCKRVSIDHPLGGDRKRVAVEVDEPLRFTRTREKARKGFEWTRMHETT